MKKLFSLAAWLLTLALCLSACGVSAEPSAQSLPQGGALRLSVNPEITVYFDEKGSVTGVEAENADADAVLAGYTGFEGKACKDVVAELVTVIGEAGYFVEEVDGSSRQITIELEPGSRTPSDAFLDEIAAEVRETVESHSWTAPVEAEQQDIRTGAVHGHDHGHDREHTHEEVRTCTNPNCTEPDCDDVDCDNGICTNPNCTDPNCDDIDCDEGIPEPEEVRTCTNPNCTEPDCDDVDCDNGICTNPNCTDPNCDDIDCDEGIGDRDDDDDRDDDEDEDEEDEDEDEDDEDEDDD